MKNTRTSCQRNVLSPKILLVIFNRTDWSNMHGQLKFLCLLWIYVSDKHFQLLRCVLQQVKEFQRVLSVLGIPLETQNTFRLLKEMLATKAGLKVVHTSSGKSVVKIATGFWTGCKIATSKTGPQLPGPHPVLHFLLIVLVGTRAWTPSSSTSWGWSCPNPNSGCGTDSKLWHVLLPAASQYQWNNFKILCFNLYWRGSRIQLQYFHKLGTEKCTSNCRKTVKPAALLDAQTDCVLRFIYGTFQ